MHQVAVHVLPQIFGANQVYAVESLQLLASQEFELILYNLTELLLQLLSDIFEEGAPLGCVVQLRQELSSDLHAFICNQNQSAILH